jgi:hypothetical protein
VKAHREARLAPRLRHPSAEVLLAMWERKTGEPLDGGIAVDSEGAVYVTEITGKRLQKFVPRRSSQLFLFVNDAIGLPPFLKHRVDNVGGAGAALSSR